MSDRPIHHSEFLPHRSPGWRDARRRKSAFSLIELLAVIMILAVLLAIGVGVGMKVMAGGDVEKTKSTMKVYLNGTERYREWKGYPETARTDDGIENNRAMTTLMAEDTQWYQKFLAELPDDAIRKNGSTFSVVDAFEYEMRFFHNQGLGGKAVMISPGPDGDFDTQDDNIRSDR